MAPFFGNADTDTLRDAGHIGLDMQTPPITPAQETADSFPCNPLSGAVTLDIFAILNETQDADVEQYHWVWQMRYMNAFQNKAPGFMFPIIRARPLLYAPQAYTQSTRVRSAADGSQWTLIATTHTATEATIEDDDAMYAGTWRKLAPWAASTAYKADEMAFDSSSLTWYRCRVEHTSAGASFSAARSANPTYWTAVAQESAYSTFGANWNANTTYSLAQYAWDTVVLAWYRCKVPHTGPGSGAFSAFRTANPTYWAAASEVFYGLNELRRDTSNGLTYRSTAEHIPPPGSFATQRTNFPGRWVEYNPSAGGYCEGPSYQCRPEYTTRAKARAATMAHGMFTLGYPDTDGGDGYDDVSNAEGMGDCISWYDLKADPEAYFDTHPNEQNTYGWLYIVMRDKTHLPQGRICDSAGNKKGVLIDSETVEADDNSTPDANDLIRRVELKDWIVSFGNMVSNAPNPPAGGWESIYYTNLLPSTTAMRNGVNLLGTAEPQGMADIIDAFTWFAPIMGNTTLNDDDIEGSRTSNGNSDEIIGRDITFTISGTFSASVNIQSQDPVSLAWTTETTLTAAGTVTKPNVGDRQYRINVSGYGSGTVTYTANARRGDIFTILDHSQKLMEDACGGSISPARKAKICPVFELRNIDDSFEEDTTGTTVVDFIRAREWMDYHGYRRANLWRNLATQGAATLDDVNKKTGAIAFHMGVPDTGFLMTL